MMGAGLAEFMAVVEREVRKEEGGVGSARAGDEVVAHDRFTLPHSAPWIAALKHGPVEMASLFAVEPHAVIDDVITASEDCTRTHAPPAAASLVPNLSDASLFPLPCVCGVPIKKTLGRCVRHGRCDRADAAAAPGDEGQGVGD